MKGNLQKYSIMQLFFAANEILYFVFENSCPILLYNWFI